MVLLMILSIIYSLCMVCRPVPPCLVALMVFLIKYKCFVACAGLWVLMFRNSDQRQVADNLREMYTIPNF